MARLTLTLLGGFEGQLDESRPLSLSARKAWALLAYLAMPPGRAHPRDKLAALLWGGVPESQARTSLRQALFLLRRGLDEAAPLLVVENESVRLDGPGVEVDAVRFEQALAPDGRLPLESAVGLYQGDLLAGLAVDEPPFEEWLLAQRERLRELALEGFARLLARQRAAGALEAGVDTALRLLALDPLQEAAHRTLMRLYAGLGRRSDALRQYRECVAVLRRELDAEPETETRQLYQEILRAAGGAAPPELAPFSAEPIAAPVGRSAADPPLLGRATELGRLSAALADAWAGEGRVVLVRGEAGIGKSRLIAELAREADHRGGRILVGHAYDGEQALPFGPWADAIRQALATLGSAELADLAPAWRTELARLVPELAERPAPPFEGPGHDRRLFEAVVALVHRLAVPRPLLLVLEDLHWADEPSLRLLAFLARRLAGHRVMALLSIRDEELVDAPGIAGRLEELAAAPGLVVPLGPLARPDVATLVQALGRAGADAAAVSALAERIWTASEGNPLLVVEATRTYGENPEAELASGSAVSDRIRDLVTGRLRRASEPARAVLAVAAVVARDAAFPLLRRAAGLGEADGAAAVEELVRRRLLREAGEGLALTHDRLREVIYERLLAPRRELLHRRVAETLEALYGNAPQPPWAALATHFREARDWQKAEAALVHLGEESARRHADEEAARAFAGALDLVPRLPADRQDRAAVEVLISLARSLYRLGRVQETVDLLEGHKARMTRLDDPGLSSHYAFCLGHAYGHLARAEELAVWAQRSLAEAERAGNAVSLGRARFLMTVLCYNGDRFEEAIAHARQAITHLAGTVERRWLGHTWYFLGVVSYFAGLLDEAIQAETQAGVLAEAIGDRRLQAYAVSIGGLVLASRGEHAAGLAACRRGLALAPDPLSVAGCQNFLGIASLEASHHADAARLIGEAAGQLGAMGARRIRCRALACLGEAHRALGLPERAGALGQEARALATADGSTYGLAWADRLLGRLARDAGDQAAARRLLGDALRGFADTHARFEVGRTHLDLGELADASADRFGARVHFGLAREAFEACGAPAYVARASAHL